MKVLIPVDGAECSNGAFQSITERAWSDDTEFLILSVQESPFLEYDVYPLPDGIIDRIRQYHESLVSAHLATLKSRFPRNKVAGSVIEGDPRMAIVDVAKESGADLIIMGSHGRGGLEKLLLGSIAEGVLRDAPCHVEVVKEKKTG